VDDSPAAQAALLGGSVPFGLERYNDRDGRPILVRRQVILTGENLQDAPARPRFADPAGRRLPRRAGRVAGRQRPVWS
ncbi:hypothetical protein CTI14_64435, partial [Methylobacterium radiotolerans]